MQQCTITSLPLLSRGKVRDVFEASPTELLFVATDRVSAFDVVFDDPIPDKGRVLTAISRFWFAKMAHIIPNHIASTDIQSLPLTAEERAAVEGRSMVVRKARTLPIEAITRGYLIGSGWKDYCATGSVCGIELPAGLQLADRIPGGPIFTPSTKAPPGEHDRNLSQAEASELLGADLYARVRDVAIAVYTAAAEYAEARGIIIADTKMEFGLETLPDGTERLILIDELLTPDSSRFWRKSTYQPGRSPDSYDKQFLRDYLETLSWDKRPPPPPLPAHVKETTQRIYLEAEKLLCG
eukprot:CAMPEP_0177657902 /NCGR_PEP_ID=MMETSP0447-20121125/16486_1 /TAXON_ID=0 /ORGANISM="Stygamoeba regulata, Strain BSH-02190019" /LENGTH=295 /DNA_ID=CAMNT_0019162395 /DNA_START=69 /DNA_END=956 /DNA_ORIENTATION=-